MTTTTIEARALLLDMDGTLVDSAGVVERIWQLFAGRFGLSVADIMSTSHGVQMIDTVRRHAPPGTDTEAITRELGAVELADNVGVVPVAGARDLLAALDGGRIALVTSATRELATVRMAAAGLPVPPTVVAAEDVVRGKPRPDCYLLAAARLGAAPADCIVFEDAEAGIRAGLAAGMRVVVVGDWASDSTLGLPRIADFTELDVVVSGPGLSVRILS